MEMLEYKEQGFSDIMSILLEVACPRWVWTVLILKCKDEDTRAYPTNSLTEINK